ncbi:deoxynucleotide monophosphate kinase [Marinobacter sp.]|uniref:deoxynucleotide monophosphate kinase family protein n=1 Tax=Marinobacter sp. TaxID=50741 RepID=UPI0035C6DFC3
MRLIGIAGKARSGKDTAAARLIEKHGLVKYSFADPLKAGIKTMFGLTEEHVNGSLKETVIPWLGTSPRKLMQTLGTEWGREIIRPDLWVLMAQRQWDQVSVATCDTFHGGMIVPDIRFEEEAGFIRRNGGLVIHLIRDELELVETHKSEAGVRFMDGDWLIENNGTIEDLHRELDREFLSRVRQVA